MADLHLREDLVQHLREIAQRENRQIDEIVEMLLTQYESPQAHATRQVDVLRQDRLRLYERARHYWQSMNDKRQHMNDEELDEQFWVIDPDGIPA